MVVVISRSNRSSSRSPTPTGTNAIANPNTTTTRPPGSRRCSLSLIQWFLVFLSIFLPSLLFQQIKLLANIDVEFAKREAVLFSEFTTRRKVATATLVATHANANATFDKSKKDTSTNTTSGIPTFTCNVSAGQSVTLPKIPNFIIAGAQKAGTTALQQFLSEHPNVQVSTSMEPHFFDWYYPPDQKKEDWFTERNLTFTSDQDELQCSIQTAYFNDHFAANFSSTAREHQHRPLQYFEKTPSYLFLTKVPERIKKTLPWGVKIIVILRNPVDRAHSHFQMSIRTFGKSFEELIDEEVQSLNQVGLSRAPSLTSFLQQDFNSTDTISMPQSNNKHNEGDDPRFSIPHRYSTNNADSESRHWKHYRRMFTNNYLQRGMYILQLRHWKQYFDDNHLLVVRYERFQSEPATVYSEILNFLDLPHNFSPEFQTRHNTKPYGPLADKTREYLTALFRPYNDLLAEELGEAWRGVWE